MAKPFDWKGLRKEANQPIILQLREFFPRIFHEVPKWRSAGLVGGYNPASFGGGHEYGLAADIYVRVEKPDEKRIGDGLLEMFMWHADQLGVEHVIWNGQKWEDGKNLPGQPRKFLGESPHTDHVHVRFKRKASQSSPPRLVFLMRELHDELFGSHFNV